MLVLLLTGQLLVLAQASFPDTGNAPLVNSSDPPHHRSKRAVFVTTPNCPEPIYLTQAQVSAWPGITVDTAQKTILNEEKRLNLFNCSEDTFFVYTHLPTVLTRADWWLACGPTMKNGWRVGKKGSSGDSSYGMIPVGCVKPTCTGLPLFEGNESSLAKYPTYQIVPNNPSLIGINQKFQFTCPLGSKLGFAASETTITLDATMKITCEAEGWWKRTSSNLAGELLSTKVACFKQLATPPPLPTACSGPALQFFDGSEPIIAANAAAYEFIHTVPSVVAGKQVFVCPTGSSLGYPIGDKKLSIEPNLKLACESTGWWVTANWWKTGAAINTVQIGCFKELPASLPPAPVSTVPKTACGCWYEPSMCSTCDSQKLFVLEGQGATTGKCTLGCANGYMFEGGDVNMISCMQGNWIGSSRTQPNVSVPYYGAFGYITTSCVPAPTPGKCPLSYSTFECEGCDKTKVIGLSSPKSSLGCVLACDKDYRLLVQTSPTNVIRAQEAVAEPGLFNVYPLGDVKTPIKVVWNNKDKYSCEPVTADPAVPVKVIDGCSATYEINTACQDCDKSKLKNLPTSDKCTVGCEDGYVLITNSANWISSALPAIQASFTTDWQALRFDGSKSGQLGSVEQSAGPLLFANCRPFTATRCSYEINTACTDCDKSQLLNLPTADKCTIGCNDGYSLITNYANSISSANPAVEASFVKEWQATGVDGSKSIIGASLFANCRPFTPTTPLSRCDYEINTACPDCDKSQLRHMRTADKCTIGCAEGYVLITNSANWISSALPALQASFAKEWDALRFDGSKSVIGASLFANCRPFTPTVPTSTSTPAPTPTTTTTPQPGTSTTTTTPAAPVTTTTAAPDTTTTTESPVITTTTAAPDTTTTAVAPGELLLKAPSNPECAHACAWRYYSNQMDIIQDTCKFTNSEYFTVVISCKNGRKATIPGYTAPLPVNMKGIMCQLILTANHVAFGTNPDELINLPSVTIPTIQCLD